MLLRNPKTNYTNNPNLSLICMLMSAGKRFDRKVMFSNVNFKETVVKNVTCTFKII